jgi:hypothetical protein
VGVEPARNARNVAIIVALALVVWLLPGGRQGAATISNLLTIVFVSGLIFLAYRFYMEQRSNLEILEDRQRAILYGSLGLIAITLVATRRLWDTGGIGAIMWLGLLGAAGYGLVSVWRAWREY